MTIEQNQLLAEEPGFLWIEILQEIFLTIKAAWISCLVMGVLITFLLLASLGGLVPNGKLAHRVQEIETLCANQSDPFACKEGYKDELLELRLPAYKVLTVFQSILPDTHGKNTEETARLFALLFAGVSGLLLATSVYILCMTCMRRRIAGAPGYTVIGAVVFIINNCLIVLRPVLWNIIPLYGQYRYIKEVLGSILVQPLTLLRRKQAFKISLEMTKGHVLSIFSVMIMLGILAVVLPFLAFLFTSNEIFVGIGASLLFVFVFTAMIILPIGTYIALLKRMNKMPPAPDDIHRQSPFTPR